MTQAIQKIAQQRASINQTIRSYFQAQSVLEVETPILGLSSTPDPYLASFSVKGVQPLYLQTSPELFMKRLLAAGSGSIFSLAKAFRFAEQSKKHNPEFTMLEWYRVGFSLAQLQADVAALMTTLMPTLSFHSYVYADLFEQQLSLNPHTATDQELLQAVTEHCNFQGQLDRSASLDLLMSQVIEKNMRYQAYFVTDYPACQAAMAKITTNHKGEAVAKRFELHVYGSEIANGYQELTDPQVQRLRWQADNEQRASLGLESIPIDEGFLKALESGMPSCAGVALGVDRLHSLVFAEQTDKNNKPLGLDSCILFAWDNL